MHSQQEPRPESQAHRGATRTNQEMANAKLLEENARLLRRVQEIETEEPFLIRAIRKREFNLAMEIINSGECVNVQDYGGMTPLHLASREIEPKVVQLLLDKGANANRLTFSTRNPGGYCALGCLVESKAQDSRWNDIYEIAKLLFSHMEKDTFTARMTTGKTLWHLLASQGKERLLKLLLDWFHIKFGDHELKKQLNTLTINDTRKGRSVLDDATFYRSCHALVANKGGLHSHPSVLFPGDRVRPGHHFHRSTHQPLALETFR